MNKSTPYTKKTSLRAKSSFCAIVKNKTTSHLRCFYFEYVTKLFVFTCLFLFKTSLFAQKTIATFPFATKLVRTASTNESYFVAEDNTIYKLDSTSTKTSFYFRHPRFGDLKNLDVSNPFRPMAFYADFQTIVFFDKKLNILSELDLKNIGFNNVTAICPFSDQQFLLFDDNEKKLKIIDYQGNTIRESIFLDYTCNILLFQGQKIIGLVNHKTLLDIDFNLEEISLFSCENLHDIELKDNTIYLHCKNSMYYFDEKDGISKEIVTLSQTNTTQNFYKNGKYFFLLNKNETIVVE